MQYLLTEEEMERVRQERQDRHRMPTREALGAFCKHAATTMVATPLSAWHIRGQSEPYGCIHVDRDKSYGYCDLCPVRSICPLPKDFSK